PRRREMVGALDLLAGESVSGRDLLQLAARGKSRIPEGRGFSPAAPTRSRRPPCPLLGQEENWPQTGRGAETVYRQQRQQPEPCTFGPALRTTSRSRLCARGQTKEEHHERRGSD